MKIFTKKSILIIAFSTLLLIHLRNYPFNSPTTPVLATLPTLGSAGHWTPTPHTSVISAATKATYVNTVDCYKLFSRGQTRLHNSYNYHAPLPETPSITNCSSFVTSRGYPKQPASDDEFRFPIAYSLVVYKDFEQFEMLLRAVYQPQNIYCIHVDRKAQRQFQDKVGKLIKCFPNVYLASKSYHVIWGRMGVIEADLICMRDLLIRHKTWKYFINLTGQEFPLKTNWEIVQQLKTSNNKSLVHALSAQ